MKKTTLMKNLSVFLVLMMVLANFSLVLSATESTPEYTTSEDIVGYSAALVERKDLSKVKSVNEYYNDTEGELKEFKISTPEELVSFGLLVKQSNNFAGLTVYLANDIDLSGVENFEPIGGWTTTQWATPAFRGTFDGQGYQIKNMKITLADGAKNPDRGYLGFFRCLGAGAVVKNLVFDENCKVDCGNNANARRTAMLAGWVDSNQDIATTSNHTVTIYNVYTQGTVVHGGGIAGGLIGQLKAAWVTIDHCTNAAKLEKAASGTSSYGSSNSNGVGGLVGMVGEGVTANEEKPNKTIPCSLTITNSRNTGDIAGGKASTGGIVGGMSVAGRSPTHSLGVSNETKLLFIDNCINNGNITLTVKDSSRDQGIAGILGLNNANATEHKVTIKNCKNYATLADPSTTIDPSATESFVKVSQIFNDRVIDNIQTPTVENNVEAAGQTDATLEEALWQHLVSIYTPEPDTDETTDDTNVTTDDTDVTTGNTDVTTKPDDETTKVEEEVTTGVNGGDKEGCGSAIAIFPVALIVLVAATVALKKKEK